jgi:hypothetical protein
MLITGSAAGMFDVLYAGMFDVHIAQRQHGSAST